MNRRCAVRDWLWAVLLSSPLCLWSPVNKALAETPSQILTGLQKPPRDCTQVPFWFWNGPLDPKEFRQQLREMEAKGVFAAMPHPRFGMDRRDYLEEPFWRAMAATLDEAKKRGMKIWLYDEYNWPSGGAGGRVTDGHPEFYPRALDYQRLKVKGPKNVELFAATNTEPKMEVFEKYISGFVRPADKTERAWQPWGKIDGSGKRICGDIAEGDWELLTFYQSVGHNPSPLDDGSNSMTDYLSEKPLGRFLALTHEEYFRRFGKYFGNVIPAVFSDESSTTAPGPFPWTDDFLGQFTSRRGGGLSSALPELLSETGADAISTRMAYWQTVADLYGQRHLGNYAAWCRAHGLKFTGHVYEENIASYAHAPQLMDLLRPMDFPGFDALGPQCPAHGAKVAISVAHLEQRQEAMCECMGLAGGWNCTLDMLRGGYNTLGCLGVSRFIPHAFFQTVENPRVECPPTFFFQNPYWKYYRAIADLSARLSYFNRIGTHVAPCAVYYPIESLWADSVGGKGQQVLPWQHRSEGNAQVSETIRVFNDVVDQLTAARWDLDVLDDRALGRADVTKMDGETRLKLAGEEFRFLIVPPITAVGQSALTKLNEFVTAGGQVLWLGRRPKAVWPMTAAEPDSSMKTTSRNTVSLPPTAAALMEWLDQHAKQDVAVRGDLGALRVNHRRSGNSDLYLLYNSSSRFVEGEARLSGFGKCAVVDLDSGRAREGQFSENWFRISLRPRQTVAVLVADDVPQLKPWSVRRPSGQGEDFSTGWEIQAAGDALDKEWRSSLGETEIQLPVFRAKKRDFQRWPKWETRDYDDSDWQPVHALRGNALFTDATPILFRGVLPPGTRSLKLPLPITGEYAIWVNGRLVDKELRGVTRQNKELPLDGFVHGVNDIVAIETISHSGAAGLEHPLTVRCGPVKLDRIKSWRDLGLGYYSGRVLYRKTFKLDAKPSQAWLDLGKVEHYAEVYVNGQLVGPLLWAPYETEITSQCRAGENEVVLVVANSIANRFAWDIWGTRGTGTAEPSGVIGPVRLWKQ